MNSSRSHIETHLTRLCCQTIDVFEALRAQKNIISFQELTPYFEEIDELIKTVPADQSTEVLSCGDLLPLIPTMRSIRAGYEFAIENELANSLVENETRGDELAEAITDDYRGSAILGAALRTKIGDKRQSCLIVGSGPLPATALLFLSRFHLDVTCQDIVPASRLISERLFHAIETYAMPKHIVSDVLTWRDFSKYDLIFINGLVGGDAASEIRSSKLHIVDHIRANQGEHSFIMLRSGYGLARLYYPEVVAPVSGGASVTSFLPEELGRSAITCLEPL